MIRVSEPYQFDVDPEPPFRNSGSGSSDPHLEKVDPDLDPSTLNIFRL